MYWNNGYPGRGRLEAGIWLLWLLWKTWALPYSKKHVVGGYGLPRYKGVLNAKHSKKVRVHFEHPHHLGLFPLHCFQHKVFFFLKKALCICCSRLPIPMATASAQVPQSISCAGFQLLVTPTSSSSYTSCCRCFITTETARWLENLWYPPVAWKTKANFLHWSWLPQVDIWSPFPALSVIPETLLSGWAGPQAHAVPRQLRALLIVSSVVQRPSPLLTECLFCSYSADLPGERWLLSFTPVACVYFAARPFQPSHLSMEALELTVLQTAPVCFSLVPAQGWAYRSSLDTWGFPFP